MNLRMCPLHSSFETLRLAGLPARSGGHGYHRLGLAASEQITARGQCRSTGPRSGGMARPSSMLADFRQA